MKPTEVKGILSHIISTLSDDTSDFLQNPSKDFSRNRKLSFETIICWIQPHTTFDYLQPKENNMYDLKFRIVRFKISDTAYETLFTNLHANEFQVEFMSPIRPGRIFERYQNIKLLSDLHIEFPYDILSYRILYRWPITSSAFGVFKLKKR